jgi:hypothetical protein
VSAELECADGRRLVLTTVRRSEQSPGKTGIIFRRPKGGCEECPPVHRCLRTGRRKASKHLQVGVPTEIADALRDALRLRRRRPQIAAGSRPRTSNTAPPLDAAPSVTAPSPVRRFAIEALRTTPGPHAVLSSLFLPASARQTVDSTLLGASLLVHAADVPPTAPPSRLVASSVGARQHRRLTWRQHLDRYALPADAEVRIEIRGGTGSRGSDIMEMRSMEPTKNVSPPSGWSESRSRGQDVWLPAAAT